MENIYKSENNFKTNVIKELKENINKLDKNNELNSLIYINKTENFNSYELILEILLDSKKKNDEKNIDFSKKLIDYLLFVNNKIVNSINFFAKSYLENSIKKNNEEQIENKQTKKNKNSVYINKNIFLEKLKKKFNLYLENLTFEKDIAYKTEYISQYFNKENKNYEKSFKFFFEIKLNEEEKSFFLSSYLSDFLYINEFYLKNNFLKDVILFNKVRNLLKEEVIEKKEKTKNNKLIENKNIFYLLYEKLFLYLNKEEMEKLEKLTFSFLYKKIYQKKITFFFEKWNSLYKNNFQINRENNFYESDYKNWEKFISNSKNGEFKNEEEFYKNKIFFDFLKKEKRSKLKESINELIKLRFLEENRILLELTNLRKKNKISKENNDKFFKEMIIYFKNYVNISEKEFENEKIKKKYILFLTQFINVPYYEEDENRKNINLTYKNIEDALSFFNLNFDLSEFILKNINSFNKEKFEKKILNKIKHFSFNFSEEIKNSENFFFFPRLKEIKDKLNREELKKNIESFIYFIKKCHSFLEDNFKIEKPNKFKIKSEKYNNNLINENKYSKISKEKIDEIEKIIRGKNNENLSVFFKKIDEIIDRSKNRKTDLNNTNFLLSLINTMYMYGLFILNEITSKNEKIKYKNYLNNFIQELKKIVDKYLKTKWEINSLFSNFSFSLKKNSLMNYVKFLNKFSDENISKLTNEKIEQINEMIKNLSFKIKKIKEFEILINDINEIKLKVNHKELNKDTIKKFLKHKEKCLKEFSKHEKNNKENINELLKLISILKAELNIFLNLQMKSLIKKISKEKLKLTFINNEFLICDEKKIKYNVNNLYREEENKKINLLKNYIIKLLEEKNKFIIKKIKVNNEYKVFNLINEFKNEIKKLEYIGPFILEKLEKENLQKINLLLEEKENLNLNK